MRILLVGFGTVGRGLARCLIDAGAELLAVGLEPRIVGVVDPATGSVARDEGLDPGRLLALAESGEGLEGYPGGRVLDDALSAIAGVDADVVLEMTPTDLRTGGPGLEHVRAALAAGRHVATTNKGPVALAWTELAELARERGVQLRCEGTVLSGTPVLNLFDAGLRGAGLRAVRGVLNGTCNFVLGRIEDGYGYDEALSEAQRLGYAETDPSGDVEGWDAAAKVTILANLLMGAGVDLAAVRRTGISGLDAERVREAPGSGRRWKLVGEARPEGDGWDLVVEPRELSAGDPLARVEGPENVVVFETRALGTVSVYGPGAGAEATGHALVADLLAIHRSARSVDDG